jgi:hypothetical protein
LPIGRTVAGKGDKRRQYTRRLPAGSTTGSCGRPRLGEWRLSFRRELGAIAGFVLLAVVQTGITNDLGSRFYAGPDPAQDVWVLDWITRHLPSPSQVFEGNNYFPSRYAVLYCDPLLGPAVLAAPFRLLSTNPIAIYNLAVILAFAVCGYGSYRLARRLWGHPAAAVLAAVLVTQCPPLMAQRAHLNLVAIGGLPLLLLGLLRVLERPHLGVALATGLALGLQGATSGYSALMGAMLAALVCLLHARAWRRPAVAANVAVVALVALLVMAPYVIGFLHLGREEVAMARGIGEARHYSVDVPLSFLRTQSIVWRPLFGASQEEPMWPGLTLLVLGALGLRRPDRHVRWLAIVAVVFFALALGPELTVAGARTIPLPFALLRRLPFLAAVKHPQTFMIPVWIVAALLAARGLARASLRPWVAALIVAAAFLETTNAWPRRDGRPLAAPTAYQLLDGQPPGAVLELPCNIVADSDAQWASIFHRRPIVNGKGAFCPDNYNRLYRVIRTEWDPPHVGPLEGTPSFAFFLARFPIRYVVVLAGAPGWLVQNVDSTPTFEKIGESADGARAYRVHHGGQGAELRRWLRADQLQAPIHASFRGDAGAHLKLTIHAHDERSTVIDERVLTGAREIAEWTIPRTRLATGMNNLQWSVDRGTFALEDLDWTEPERR